MKAILIQNTIHHIASVCEASYSKVIPAHVSYQAAPSSLETILKTYSEVVVVGGRTQTQEK